MSIRNEERRRKGCQSKGRMVVGSFIHNSLIYNSWMGRRLTLYTIFSEISKKVDKVLGWKFLPGVTVNCFTKYLDHCGSMTLAGTHCICGDKRGPHFYRYYNHCVKIRPGHALNDSILCKQWSVRPYLAWRYTLDCILRMEDDSARGLTQEQIHQWCTTHAAQNDNSVPRIENDI